jgi:hypothetical protein
VLGDGDILFGICQMTFSLMRWRNLIASVHQTEDM